MVYCHPPILLGLFLNNLSHILLINSTFLFHKKQLKSRKNLLFYEPKASVPLNSSSLFLLSCFQEGVLFKNLGSFFQRLNYHSYYLKKNNTISIHSEGVPLVVVGIKNFANRKMNIDRCGMILSRHLFVQI